MRHLLAVAALLALAGCGSWWPFSGPQEQSRIPSDAVVYQCEKGKQLAVRFMDEERSVMVSLPEREFRLDRTDGGRYTNGISTFDAGDEGAWLEMRGERTHSGCKRPAA